MKYTIKKKHLKAMVGTLILAVALSTPAIAGRSDDPRPDTPSEAVTDEEAHIELGMAEDLLLFEDNRLDRHYNKTPGLILDGDASRSTEPEVERTPKKELVEQELEEKARLMEEEKAKEEARRKEVAKKEAQRKEAERKEAERKAAEERAALEKAEAVKEETPAADQPATEEARPSAGASNQFLIPIDRPDPNYKGRPLSVSDRQTLEGLVMGEWGNDYLGAVLVAQCIRDSMVKEGTNSTAVIKRKYGYTAPVKRNVSSTVKKAVAFVFDEGGSGVQHPIYYFYASNIARGKWHETQNFVVQRKAVRFFSPRR